MLDIVGVIIIIINKLFSSH